MVGTEHADYGEEVCAVVVAAEAAVTEDELKRYMVERIARYEVPIRWILRTEELPRNATGKVKRVELRASICAS